MLNEFKSIAARLEADFERSSQMQHRGLKGAARERALVNEFLKDHLPGKFLVGSGEIWDSAGHISRQQDIVVYDGYNIPVLQNFGEVKVFFAEQIYTVIEVKSTLAHGEIKDIIEKGRSVNMLQRAGIGASSRIPVFGFAYTSTMNLQQIRDYSQKRGDQLDGGWGVSAIVILSDADNKTGLITNVDNYYTRSVKLFSASADPTAVVVTKSKGESLLTFYMLLLEAIKLVEAVTALPSYLAYATSGGLGTVDILIGEQGATRLAYQKALLILKNAHNASDQEVIYAWQALLKYAEANSEEPLINDGEYFAIGGQFAGGPTTREVWKAVERYIQGQTISNDEHLLEFLVSALRKIAQEDSFIDFVRLPM